MNRASAIQNPLNTGTFHVPGILVPPSKNMGLRARRYAVKPFGNSQKGNVKRWLTWRKAWDKLPLIR